MITTILIQNIEFIAEVVAFYFIQITFYITREKSTKPLTPQGLMTNMPCN